MSTYKYKLTCIDGSSYELSPKAYPTSVQLSSNIVSRSWNNYKGQFQDVLVNHKLKFAWIFDFISTSHLDSMLSYIFSKIENAGNATRFFYMTGYFPGRGWLETLVYLGTPLNINSIGPNEYQKNGQPGWWKCELHWIEVDGTVLLAPEQSNNQQNSRGIIINNKKIEIANSGDISNILNEAS